ncbi:MAG: LysM peptidoglycan-binding domain-containing protein [Pirellulales bacterium]|nr:LysM peptidoglycan-binding domain-containing protein [Pirellulales bacterium]
MNDEEQAVESSRFGREAKIGVVVILALLLVFVGVMAYKLVGASPGEGLASAAVQDSDDSQQQDAEPNEDLFPESLDEPEPRGVDSPKVLVAQSGSDTPPKPVGNDFDQWKSASDEGKAKPVEGEGPVLISPPPLPPEPNPGNRYDNRSRDPFTAGNHTPLQSEEPADASRPSTAEQPERRGPNYGEESVDRAEPSGYSSAAEAPPPLPPYRERGRYDDAGRFAPADQSYPDRSYSDASEQADQAAPASQHGSSENQRRPSPSYDERPRRRDGHRAFDSPPAALKDGKYEVQPLDSFWTISEKLYGAGAYYKALMEHNRDKMDDEGKLQPGALVVVPTVEQLEKAYPDLCPKPSRRETLQDRTRNVGTRRNYHSGRTYTVAEGDTLFEIARYELGKAARWVEIYELNRDVLGKDFNYITPGTKLYLPDSGRPDVLAEPPNDGYRR